MKTGINFYSKWPYEQVVQAFLKNGVDTTFVCVGHPQFDDVMAMLKKVNITVENLHAPFRGINDIWQEGKAGDEMLEKLLYSVDCCVKYNVGIMVAHVSSGRPMAKITDIGLKRFDRLMEYAKQKNVTVAFESHRYRENVQYIIERYPEAGFCLDTCHEYAFTPGIRYIPLWSDRLVATHISDNDDVYDKDKHMLPFDGVIDFKKTAYELANCKKDVTLMLEVKPDNHERYANVSINDYYERACKSLKQLKALVDEYKKQSIIL